MLQVERDDLRPLVGDQEGGLISMDREVLVRNRVYLFSHLIPAPLSLVICLLHKERINQGFLNVSICSEYAVSLNTLAEAGRNLHLCIHTNQFTTRRLVFSLEDIFGSRGTSSVHVSATRDRSYGKA